MTPTALTPAGRGVRRSTPGPAGKRQPAKPAGAVAVAHGARSTVHGARATAEGARTAAQGARTAVQGARTAAEGTRTMAEGARTAARGARAAAEGARTVAQGARVATQRPTAAPGKTRAATRRAPVSSGRVSGRGAGHRSSVTRSTLPRAPRRISGPARPRRTRAAQPPAVREALTARCAAFVRALPDHALLDRIIRGRYWIPLLGILLVGIVAMQVEVLKLNAGIGRALEQSTSLQIRNEQLQAAVGRAADDQRIESTAAHMGMVMAPPAAIRFLERHPAADGAKAVGNIHAPNATGFQAALSAPAASTAATGTSTGTGTGSSSTGA